jgi:type I restriction enzyme, S subunit
MTSSSQLDLPQNWCWTTIQEISQTTSGGTPSRKNNEFFKGKIPWLKSGELADNLNITSSEELINQKALDNSSAKIVQKGSLLVALYGATVGKLGLLGIDAAINQAICAIQPYEGINAKYLYYYLSSYRKYFLNARKGGAQPNISQEIVKSAIIPLAPSAEQLRIIGKVEELFSFWDAGVASLRAVNAQLKHYRQAVLKAAFEGKLTEQWRLLNKDKIEPATILFEEIKGYRTKRNIKQWNSPTGINLPALSKIPESWIWVNAQEVCENITNGYTPKGSELNKPNAEIPFIKIYNLTFTGELDFSKNPTFISKEIHQTELKRSKVLPGDVLTNIVGPPLGKVSIVPNTYPEWNINQAIVFFRPLEGCNRDFLALCLQTDSIIRYLTNQAKATAGQFNISVNMSRNLPIPLPPIEEQNKIVSAVKKHFAMLENAKVNLNTSLTQVNYLRNSILSAAFSGTLVPQDPMDEPADVLLKRIKAKTLSIKSKNKTQRELFLYVK